MQHTSEVEVHLFGFVPVLAESPLFHLVVPRSLFRFSQALQMAGSDSLKNMGTASGCSAGTLIQKQTR